MFLSMFSPALPFSPFPLSHHYYYGIVVVVAAAAAGFSSSGADPSTISTPGVPFRWIITNSFPASL
jgi:hypothetical protein